MRGPNSQTLFNRVRINSVGTLNLREADTPLAFARGPHAKATLQVELHTSCCPFKGWRRA